MITPRESAAAANSSRTILRHGLFPCRATTSRRTAASKRAGPKRRRRAGSPSVRARMTLIAASQVRERDQQVTDLLDLAARLSEQPFAAGPQVPQPCPPFIQWFGDVAAQLRGQPRNQDGVFLIGLVEGQVLAATRHEV